MGIQWAESPSARRAYEWVRELQGYFVSSLETIPSQRDGRPGFEELVWLRAEGRCGGGSRYVAVDDGVFNRASVNVSQVHYEQDPRKALGSASALSAIVHPRNPFAPSVHLHISWTELKSGEGYWRIMADLNPSIPHGADTRRFDAAMQSVAGEIYAVAKQQGERYFYIPSLRRHRGVAHFYLEDYRRDRPQDEDCLARRFGRTVITSYTEIVTRAIRQSPPVTEREWQQQLAYHSLYFLQVLTLDRGTTSGLLVHDENDTGILGSLPSHVDKRLLQSWLSRLPSLQEQLLRDILSILPEGNSSLVDDTVKVKIAEIARRFYREHPEAQELLARGDVIPPTQENHR